MPVVEVILRSIDQGNFNKSAGGLANLAVKYLSVAAVAGTFYKVIKDSVDTVFKYDEAVRQLAEVSGTGAEESSRLLQVLDDFKLVAGFDTANFGRS